MKRVTAGRWMVVLAAGWVIWSRKGIRKYAESPSMACRMFDLGASEVVVLATKNSKARPTIVRRTATRPNSSFVSSPGTALSQTSSSSDRRLSIGKSDSRKPSASGIAFGKNCTTPVSSVAVTTLRALALSWKGSSVTPLRLIRVAAAEAMVV